MDSTLVIIIGVVLLAGIVGILVVFLMTSGKGGAVQQVAVSDSLRSLVAAQRQQQKETGRSASRKSLALAAAAEDEGRARRNTSSRLTLEKRLRYGRWVITPIQFRAIQVVLCVSGLLLTRTAGLTLALQILGLFLPPMLFNAALNRSINKRFKMFDDDYPVMLMQYVSLLKTGMGTIQGLEAAAKGLDEGSLVRSEAELLVERLRLGLTEEQAISSFGEDVAHPELELFVQSLLLSRRVGGTLSTTLERLAKQVRKRQQFRQQAVSAVGMERGSIYAIAVIMTLLMLYIGFSQPDLVIPAFTDPLGTMIFQGGVFLIICGFLWSRVVTNIKV